MMKVDTETAREHATRLAEGKGYNVKMTKQGDDMNLEMNPK
jgi:hypothetical protein